MKYDANVNTTANKLRLALGDSPEKPMYVDTIPRQGYCFLGNVERGNELLNISGRFAALFRKGWGVAILLCGVLIGVGIVLLMHRPS